MSIKKYSTYTYEHDGETFPLPFDPEGGPEKVYVAENGLKAILAFLVRDDSPADPFEEFDEGDFYQFNNRYKHYTPRPDIEEFKRIVIGQPVHIICIVRGFGQKFYMYCRVLSVNDNLTAVISFF